MKRETLKKINKTLQKILKISLFLPWICLVINISRKVEYMDFAILLLLTSYLSITICDFLKSF